MKELSFSQQRLLEAITNCRIYQTRQLLDTGTPAEFQDEEGYSPLLRAFFIDDERHRTRTSLIKLLILYGADVNTTDPLGRHALTYACMMENQEILQLLLDMSIHNIDLNKKDYNGDTPLIHAVRLGNVNIVMVLVDAMNKFKINMDVRNNADRTPYLEAKHLGRTECAEILLEKANASRDVLVNPFLEFIESKEETFQYGGDVRGIDCIREKVEEKDRGDKDQLGSHVKSKPKREIKNLTNIKRLTKRQCTKNSALKSRNTENKPISKERKQSSDSIQNTCVISDVLREIQVGNENNEDEPERILKSSIAVKKETYLATGKIEKDGILSVNTVPQVPRVRPSTAIATRSELKQVKNRENRDPLLCYNTFLTDGTPPVPQVSHRVFAPRHSRSKTAPSRRIAYNSQSTLSCESAKQSTRRYSEDSEISWYSHFSIHTSPSVNFMNKIMALYGEQLSPESSYRRGVKTRKSEYTPTIVAPPDSEHDKHSDGRRSSSGSVRSLSGSVRNRKFSAITKTVASYLSSRKAMSTGKAKN